jgi:hypothetical protein
VQCHDRQFGLKQGLPAGGCVQGRSSEVVRDIGARGCCPAHAMISRTHEPDCSKSPKHRCHSNRPQFNSQYVAPTGAGTMMYYYYAPPMPLQCMLYHSTQQKLISLPRLSYDSSSWGVLRLFLTLLAHESFLSPLGISRYHQMVRSASPLRRLRAVCRRLLNGNGVMMEGA